MKKLLQITARAPRSAVDAATVYLSLHAASGWQEEEHEDGARTFTVHLEDGPAAREVAAGLGACAPGIDVASEAVEPQDWALAWREFFTPVEAGETFTVLPPWLADQAGPGRIPIVIEPKQAFGTGHHGTTAMFLAALAGLVERGLTDSAAEFLDLGTGSGILGLGCCLLGMHGLGLDIDPLAIENAEENKALNGVGEAFSLAVGSLELLEPGRTFPLVLANILAGPLKTMAEDLAARVAPGGCLVLSGILGEQADSVAAAYQAQGLPAPRREQAGEWTALVWERVAR